MDFLTRTNCFWLGWAGGILFVCPLFVVQGIVLREAYRKKEKSGDQA